MAMSSGDDEEGISGINVTPLVDVCLVLVIIFMVTAPMMSDPVIKVTLPKAHADQDQKESEKVTITLGKGGELGLDEKVYKTMAEMNDDLKIKIAQSVDKVVIVRADADALHGKLADVMAAAKDAGAVSLTVATDKADDGGGK